MHWPFVVVLRLQQQRNLDNVQHKWPVRGLEVYRIRM